MEGKIVDFSSDGGSSLHKGHRMGTYTRTSQVVKECPVFKQEERVENAEDDEQYYLFVGPDNCWRVGPDVTSYTGSVLKHPKKKTKSPPESGWLYYCDEKWREDASLRATIDTKKEKRKFFYLEKQSATVSLPGRPGRPGLYLTNPENTNKLVLTEQDFSPNQAWYWSNNMLMCATGKVLDMDINAEPLDEAPILAKSLTGLENQKFYPFNIVSPMIPDKEFCFIGRLAEKETKGDPQVFFTILEDGNACMKTVDSYHLHAKNKQNTIDMCWKFVYRQIEAKEEDRERFEKELEMTDKKHEATLGDLVGVMGGLMAAFAPPEQGAEIEKQMEGIQLMGEAVGALFKGFGEGLEELSDPAYSWVTMDTDQLPRNAFPAGRDGSPDYNVWVGRAEENGEFRVGKVHNSDRYFASEGFYKKRVTSQPFSVLCVDPWTTFSWVAYKQGEIPKNAVIGGTSANKTNILVGRSVINNKALTPGFVYTDNEPYTLNALWDGGRVHSLEKFEILVVNKDKTKENEMKQGESKVNENKTKELNSMKQNEGKKEVKVKFYMEKQAATQPRPGRPGRPGLYLTNPENTNKLVLAEQDFSPSQTWYWSNNMLMCETGKVLDIEGRFKPDDDAPVLAWEPHGGENQHFYPFKIVSPMIPDKEFCLIGRFAEKDIKPSNRERVFFNIKEDGTACLNTVDDYLLHAKNKQNTIDMCWNFVYRMIPAKEENRKAVKNEVTAAKEKESNITRNEMKNEKQEASLGDLVGVMGGLMAAFAPPEQGAEIQKEIAGLSQTLDKTGMEVNPKEPSMPLRNKEEVLDLLNKIQSIEAEIDIEEEMYNKKIQEMKENHKMEMKNLREKLNATRKEFKDSINSNQM